MQRKGVAGRTHTLDLRFLEREKGRGVRGRGEGERVLRTVLLKMFGGGVYGLLL